MRWSKDGDENCLAGSVKNLVVLILLTCFLGGVVAQIWCELLGHKYCSVFGPAISITLLFVALIIGTSLMLFRLFETRSVTVNGYEPLDW